MMMLLPAVSAADDSEPPTEIPIPDIHIQVIDTKVYSQLKRGAVYTLNSSSLPAELDDVLALTQEWYPRLREMLWTKESLATDSVIHVYLRDEDPEGKNAVARVTVDNTLVIYDRYLKQIRAGAADPQKAVSGGVIIHELTHLLQAKYRNDRRHPRWLIEALADYYRFSVFESYTIHTFLKHTQDAKKTGNIEVHFKALFCRLQGDNTPCQTFQNEGYLYHHQPIHAAGMLVMIEHRFPGLTKKIHRKLFETNSFFDNDMEDFLYAETGKGLQQSWCEYMALVDGKSEETAAISCAYRLPDRHQGWFW